MPNVSVVTDSCASIPESLMEALTIHWVPYYLQRGNEVLCARVTRQLSPVLGVHTSPGTAGVGCLSVGAGKP